MAASDLRKFAKETSGNVAMLFGFSALPLIVAVGMAMDMGNQSRTAQKLTGIADAIALAVAKEHRNADNRNEIAQRFLNGNLSDTYGPDLQITNLSVEFDDDAEVVDVALTADVPTVMMGIAGIDKLTTTVHSSVSYEAHASEPVSVGMVLDVSGSMSWYGKIGTLRTAATSLLDRLDEADPDQVYVRTGLTTYYTYVRNTVGMDWGIDHTRSVVQGLWANGGTRSTQAFNTVGDWLVDPTELAEHEAQPVHEDAEFELHKFMIFMTDGDNNYSYDDTATEALCDQYKAQGIEIFAVAFEAPYNGRQLLQYCASSEEHYYDADNSEEFLLAFDEIGERIQRSLIRIVE